MVPHDFKVGDKVTSKYQGYTGIVSHVDETVWVGVKVKHPFNLAVIQFYVYKYDDLEKLDVQDND